jgi:hypothetical protein
VVRTFDLSPGVRGAWYIVNSYAPELRELEAIMPANDQAVLAVRGGEAGKEATVETLVRNVLSAYVRDTVQGFCVGHGAITSEPGLNEETRITFQHRKLHQLSVRF